MQVLTLPLVAGFTFPGFLMLLIWAVWVVLNLWIWQKTKAMANLLMLVASAYFVLDGLMGIFDQMLGGLWMHLIALGVLTAGFFLSVQAQVKAQLDALKAKIHSATAKKDGGAPPSA